MRTSVWLLFAASLPLTVIGFLLGPWMLRLMQVPADAMPGAVLYLRITMLGILGNMAITSTPAFCAAGQQLVVAAAVVYQLRGEYRAGSCTYGALGLGIGGVAAATAIALFCRGYAAFFTFAAAAQSLRCLFCLRL